MSIAYFNCIGGASGDMTLGALVDAGLSLEALAQGLQGLGVPGYRLSSEVVQRGGLAATHVGVAIEPSGQTPRTLSAILSTIEAASLPQVVKDRASAIFRRLGEAEATVHRTSIQEVHFHEVGALDAIVDIVGSALGIHLLGVEQVFCSPFPAGMGVVKIRQGVLPVPAPAMLELVRMSGAPVRPTQQPEGELVTPTGAAIMTTLASFDPPTMRVAKVGYGAGTRDIPGLPNVLGLWLGEAVATGGAASMLLVETNIDDMSPQLYGYVMERLLALGARDVWFTPIQMKKNRPGVLLSVLAPPELEGVVAETLLRETTTLGVRVREVKRHEAEREVVAVETSLGRVQVKLKRLGGRVVSVAPEYEDCKRIAEAQGLPLQEVMQRVRTEAEQKLVG